MKKKFEADLVAFEKFKTISKPIKGHSMVYELDPVTLKPKTEEHFTDNDIRGIRLRKLAADHTPFIMICFLFDRPSFVYFGLCLHREIYLDNNEISFDQISERTAVDLDAAQKEFVALGLHLSLGAKNSDC